MDTTTAPSNLADIVTSLSKPIDPDDRLEDLYTALNAVREALLDMTSVGTDYLGDIAGPLDVAESHIERLRICAALLVIEGDANAPF